MSVNIEVCVNVNVRFFKILISSHPHQTSTQTRTHFHSLAHTHIHRHPQGYSHPSMELITITIICAFDFARVCGWVILYIWNSFTLFFHFFIRPKEWNFLCFLLVLCFISVKIGLFKEWNRTRIFTFRNTHVLWSVRNTRQENFLGVAEEIYISGK